MPDYFIQLQFGVLKIQLTALLEGICATLNSHIQPLKLYICYFLDIFLKDAILAKTNPNQTEAFLTIENKNFLAIGTVIAVATKVLPSSKVACTSRQDLCQDLGTGCPKLTNSKIFGCPNF